MALASAVAGRASVARVAATVAALAAAASAVTVDQPAALAAASDQMTHGHTAVTVTKAMPTVASVMPVVRRAASGTRRRRVVSVKAVSAMTAAARQRAAQAALPAAATGRPEKALVETARSGLPSVPNQALAQSAALVENLPAWRQPGYRPA